MQCSFVGYCGSLSCLRQWHQLSSRQHGTASTHIHAYANTCMDPRAQDVHGRSRTAQHCTPAALAAADSVATAALDIVCKRHKRAPPVTQTPAQLTSHHPPADMKNIPIPPQHNLLVTNSHHKYCTDSACFNCMAAAGGGKMCDRDSPHTPSSANRSSSSSP